MLSPKGDGMTRKKNYRFNYFRLNLRTIKWPSDHSFLLHAFEICNFCKSSFLKNLDHIKLVILLMHLLVLFKESEGPLKVTKAVTSVKHVDLFQCAFVNIGPGTGPLISFFNCNSRTNVATYARRGTFQFWILH